MAKSKAKADPKPLEPKIPQKTVAELQQQAEADKQDAARALAQAEHEKAILDGTEGKPVVSYQVLSRHDVSPELDLVRVKVMITPSFNGFTDGILSIGLKKTDDHEALCRQKAAWKANQQSHTDKIQWKAEEVEVHEERESQP